MMAILQLPLNPKDEKQLKKKVAILEKAIPDNHKKGILVYPGASLKDVSRSFSQIKQAIIAHCPSDWIITLHVPFSAHAPCLATNVSHEESLDIFSKTIALADDINANSITMHLGTNMYAPTAKNIEDEKLRWAFGTVDDEKFRRDLVDKAFENVKRLSRTAKMKIGVENMPIPLKGNVTTNPDEVLYEPLMATAECLVEYARYFRKMPNVGVCFDTAHYGLLKDTINEIRKKQGLVNNDTLMKAGYPALYPDRLGIQPGMIELYEKLLEAEGRIVDVQLSDYGNIWRPVGTPNCEKGTMLKEGIGLLEGTAGMELLEFGKRVAEKSASTPFSLDVEVKEMSYPVEQVSSLLMFVDYLDEGEAFKSRAEKGALIKHYKEKAMALLKQLR